MIRLYKTKSSPKTPTSNVKKVLETIAKLASSGQKTFSKQFKTCANHYTHADVTTQLEKDQGKKCCYCEGKPTAHSYLEVEHFRPKSAVNNGVTTLKPGYYWLVCEWKNLYWSCKKCNGSPNKGTQFPLLNNPPYRARKPGDPIDSELPVLVDPYEDDPTDFFAWRKEAVRGIDPKQRGKESIRIYGLDRHDLVEARLAQLDLLKSYVKLFKHSLENDDIGEIIEYLDNIAKMVSPKGLYSAMCRAFIIADLEKSSMDPNVSSFLKSYWLVNSLTLL